MADERRFQQAAFRSGATGQVIVTGPCHDLLGLPGGLDANLDAAARFLTRATPAAA
jgi:hypothetical protein